MSTEQTAPEQSTGLATLVLQKLTCQVSDDTLGDEPIIMFDGEEIWRASGVDNGDIREVDVRRAFSDSVIIELFDEEFGADDKLGSKVITADEAGLGNRQAFFNQRPQARYILAYRVE